MKKRVLRINFDNIIYLMVIETPEELEQFRKIKGIRKIGFYHMPIEDDDTIIYVPGWRTKKKEFSYFFRKYIHSLFEEPAGEIDFLSLASYDLTHIVRNQKDICEIVTINLTVAEIMYEYTNRYEIINIFDFTRYKIPLLV